MALQTTGPISLDDIQTEFGGTNPISISEYYGEGGVPSSGTISIGDFYGASSTQTFEIREFISHKPTFGSAIFIDISFLTTPEEGEKIIVCLVLGTSSTITIPSGFTEILTEPHSSINYKLKAYQAEAPGDVNAFRFSFNNSTDVAWAAYRIGGAKNATVTTGSAADNTATTTLFTSPATLARTQTALGIVFGIPTRSGSSISRLDIYRTTVSIVLADVNDGQQSVSHSFGNSRTAEWGSGSIPIHPSRDDITGRIVLSGSTGKSVGVVVVQPGENAA